MGDLLRLPSSAGDTARCAYSTPDGVVRASSERRWSCLGVGTTVVMGASTGTPCMKPMPSRFILVPCNDMAAFAVTDHACHLLAQEAGFPSPPDPDRDMVLTAAGFGRFPVNFPPPLNFYNGVDLLIFLGVDTRPDRESPDPQGRTLRAAGAELCANPSSVYIVFHNVPFWVKIARGHPELICTVPPECQWRSSKTALFHPAATCPGTIESL